MADQPAGPEGRNPAEVDAAIDAAFGLDPVVAAAPVAPGKLSDRAQRTNAWMDPAVPLADDGRRDGDIAGEPEANLGAAKAQPANEEPLRIPEHLRARAAAARRKAEAATLASTDKGIEVSLGAEQVRITKYDVRHDSNGKEQWQFTTADGKTLSGNEVVDPAGKHDAEYHEYLRSLLEIPELINDVEAYVASIAGGGAGEGLGPTDLMKYAQTFAEGILNYRRTDTAHDESYDAIYADSPLPELTSALQKLYRAITSDAQKDACYNLLVNLVPDTLTPELINDRLGSKTTGNIPEELSKVIKVLTKKHRSRLQSGELTSADIERDALVFLTFKYMDKLAPAGGSHRNLRTEETYHNLHSFIEQQVADAEQARAERSLFNRFRSTRRLAQAAENGDLAFFQRRMAKLNVRQETLWVRQRTFELYDQYHEHALVVATAKHIAAEERKNGVVANAQDIKELVAFVALEDDNARRSQEANQRNSRLRRGLKRYHNLSIPVKAVTGFALAAAVPVGALWLTGAGAATAVTVGGAGLVRGARMGMNRTAASVSGFERTRQTKLDRAVAKIMSPVVRMTEKGANWAGSKSKRYRTRIDNERNIGIGHDAVTANIESAMLALDLLHASTPDRHLPREVAIEFAAKQAAKQAKLVRGVERAKSRSVVKGTIALVGAGAVSGVFAKAAAASTLGGHGSGRSSGGRGSYGTVPPRGNGAGATTTTEHPPTTTLPPRSTSTNPEAAGGNTTTEQATTTTSAQPTTSTTEAPTTTMSEQATTSSTSTSTSTSTTTTSTTAPPATANPEVTPPNSEPNTGSSIPDANTSGNGSDVQPDTGGNNTPTPERIHGVPADKWESMTATQRKRWDYFTRDARPGERRAFANYLTQVDEQRRAFVAEQNYPAGYITEHPNPERTGHLLNINISNTLDEEYTRVRNVARAAWIDATGHTPTTAQLRAYTGFLRDQGEQYGAITNGHFAGPIADTPQSYAVPILRRDIRRILELTEEERRRRLLGAAAANSRGN